MGTLHQDVMSRLRAATAALRDARSARDALVQERHEPLAVIGLACRFPGGGHDAASFWASLERGADGVRTIPESRWPKSAVPDDLPGARWAALLDDVAGFDAGFFGVSAREAEVLDPQQRLLLEVAWEALEDAGVLVPSLAGTSAGVFIGVSRLDYQERLSAYGRERLEASAAAGNGFAGVATRVSSAFRLHGPSLAVDTEGSASLVALALACQSLRSGESSIALAGGVNLLLSPTTMGLAAQSQELSPEGRCRALDANATGTVRGEGCGLVVLKRLSDAQRDHDTVRAVIRGWAINQAGGPNAPDEAARQAQEVLLRGALADARLAPAEVGHLELDATGVARRDGLEAESLRAVYGAQRPDGSRCTLGVVKPNLGHLEAASGIAGVLKTVLALEHERVPPNLHHRALHPRAALVGTPLVFPTESVAWPRQAAPRRAGVSAFGVGGTQAHVLIEEAPARAPVASPHAERRLHLLPVSAQSAAGLCELVAEYAQALRGAASVDDFVYTASARRSHHAHRWAVVGHTGPELASALEARVVEARAAALPLPGQAAAAGGRLLFAFPGQSSVWAGMGRELLADEPAFREALQRCAAAIRREDGPNVEVVLRSDDVTQGLADVAVGQPVVFAVEVALAALWSAWGVVPDVVLGQGLGEVAAAHVAGMLTLEDAAKVVCRQSRLLRRLDAKGSSTLPELTLVEVREALLRDLKELRPRQGTLTMRSTVTGAVLQGPELDAQYWANNLTEPSLLSKVAQAMFSEGVTRVVEISSDPGLLPVIEPLLAERSSGRLGVASLRKHAPERRTMLESLGALYSSGNPVDWTKQHPAGGRCVPLPAYAWQRERYWLEYAPSGAPEAPSAALEAQRPVEQPAQWWSLTWQGLPPLQGRPAGKGRWVVLAPAGSSSWPLVTRLEAAGAKVSCVRQGPATRAASRQRSEVRLGATPMPSTPSAIHRQRRLETSGAHERPGDEEIDFTDGAQVRSVLARLSVGPEPLSGIVLVACGEARRTPASLATVASAQPNGVGVALSVVQALLTFGAEVRPRLWLVTRGTQCVEGSPVMVEHAPLWGLGRAIAAEHPELRCGRIDLAPTESQTEADELAAELLGDAPEDEVALRRGARFGSRVVLDVSEPNPLVSAVRGDASYLITGGLGRLGLLAAHQLAEEGARHLVLVGRTGASTDAQRAAVRALEARGVKVLVAKADVAQPEQLAAVLRDVDSRLPPLRGVFHAAGVSSDGLLSGQTRERLEAVLAPKVRGAFALHEQTLGRPLDFFVLYSSVSSLLGTPGQGSDGAANAFLDALAQARRGLGLAGQSVQWGPYALPAEPVGAQASLAFDERGLASFSSLQAQAHFATVLRAKWTERAVLSVDLARLAEACPSVAGAPRFAQLLAGTRSSSSSVWRRTSAVPGRWLEAPKPNPKARVRLLCIPDAGGSPALFSSWCAGLPQEVEVLAAHLPGRLERQTEPSLTSVQAMAAGLLPAVLPYLDKPLAVFGHGLGAMVMFELLQALHASHRGSALQAFASGAASPDRYFSPGVRHHTPREFAALLRSLGFSESGVDVDPQGQRVPDAAVRSDFEAAAAYEYRNSATLEVPITALAGIDDPFAPEAQVAHWRWHTRAHFVQHTFSGGRYFLKPERERLLALLGQELLARLAALEQQAPQKSAEGWLALPPQRKGARVRLFVVAALAPEPPSEWGAQLGAQVELCPVLLPGRGPRSGELPLARVEELAEQLVPRVVAQADRPFAFLGFDVGALVLYEVARRLCRRGSYVPTHLFVAGAVSPAQHFFPPITGLPTASLCDGLRQLGYQVAPKLSERALRAACAALASYAHEPEPALLSLPITAFEGGWAMPPMGLQAWESVTSRGFIRRAIAGARGLELDSWRDLADAIRVSLS
jgi:acyl transferase domain-containing protein/surfactin synthase thioesterase subunit